MTLVLLTAYPNCRVYSEEGNLDYYITELSPGHTNQLPPHVGNPELAFAWSLPRGLWPLATHYDQLCLVTCLRPSTCGPRRCLRDSISQPWENSTSLQNGITYLLEDKVHGGHPSLVRAQFMGQLLLTLYVTPTPHTQHWPHEGDVQPR
jgi:hypothetical protein